MDPHCRALVIRTPTKKRPPQLLENATSHRASESLGRFGFGSGLVFNCYFLRAAGGGAGAVSGSGSGSSYGSGSIVFFSWEQGGG